MKIANIVFSSQNGGVEQVAIDYSLVLKNLGHDIIVIARSDAPYISEIEQLGIKVEKINNYFGYGDIFAISKIANILKKHNIDLVFSHANKASALTARALKKINKSNQHKKIYQIAINHSNNVKRSLVADIVLSVNKAIFYKTIDLGRKYDNSFVVPNAINITAIDDVVRLSNLAKKKVIKIGVIGQLVKFKGFDHIIKAIKHLTSDPDIKSEFMLKIAGSGKEEMSLKQLVKDLNLEKKIEFCGWVTNKDDFFKQIDIFCLPSLNETFGLVMIEAMKYKVPIITTNCDGPKEIIKDKVDGLIVTIEPLESLDQRMASAIKKLANDDQLVNDLVVNAFDKLKNNYSFASLAKNLGDVLDLIPKDFYR
jgi:glycosyltransferase involved in cell wall biosynthesis